jgi:hypothetical protein
MALKRATQQSTIEALLDASKRDHLPLANLFVQHRDAKGKGIAGPLADFVGAHHDRALHQYLLAHAAASGGAWDIAYESPVWARSLGLSDRHASSANAISRNWAWLERRQLISRSRSGRLAKITLLYDDGSGDPYRHPSKRKDQYLRLPYAFWREEWYRRLDLPAIAVLLIGLSLRPGQFRLPQERVYRWYGISTSTFQKGVQTLVRAELLRRIHIQEEAPLLAQGFTRVNLYELRRPFARKRRKKGS